MAWRRHRLLTPSMQAWLDNIRKYITTRALIMFWLKQGIYYYKTEVIEYLKADLQGLANVRTCDIELGRSGFYKKRIHSALGLCIAF